MLMLIINDQNYFLRRQLAQEREPTPRTFFENGSNPAGEARQRYSILQLCSAEAENPEQNILYRELRTKSYHIYLSVKVLYMSDIACFFGLGLIYEH